MLESLVKISQLRPLNTNSIGFKLLIIKYILILIIGVILIVFGSGFLYFIHFYNKLSSLSGFAPFW